MKKEGKTTGIKRHVLIYVLVLIMVCSMMPALAVPAFAEGDIVVPPEKRINGAVPIGNTYTVNGKEMIKDPDSFKAETSSRLSSQGTLPDRYRSDEQPWAKGIRIKDQFSSALCWAFSVTNAAEYSFAKEVYERNGQIGVVREMSPGHIGQFAYNRVNDRLGNTSGDCNEIGWNDWANLGGDEIFAMQHLATWSGAALEEKYPIDVVDKHISFDNDGYPFWDGIQNIFPASGAYDDELTLQESILIRYPEKNTLKELILKYGALSYDMEFDYEKYMSYEEINPETGTAYLAGRSFYNYTGEYNANHAITIIGWDDTYPKENFSHVIRSEVDEAREAAEEAVEKEARAKAEEKYKNALIGKNLLIETYVNEYLSKYKEQFIAEAVAEAEKETREKTTPQNDGAWVIQNSWGDYTHENGILYASYEDADFNLYIQNEAIAYDMQPADTYKYNFQYDGTMSNSCSADIFEEDGSHLPFYTRPGTRAANVYTNDTGEAVNLEAVGYTTYTTGAQGFDVSIYTGLTDMSDPTSGKCKGTTRIGTDTKGVKTAALEKPVYIAPGETYSIVFDFLDYSSFGFETTADGGFLTFVAQIDPGQSFFCRSKKDKWTDMNDYEACFRIKGFANPTELIPDPQPAPAQDQAASSPAETSLDSHPAKLVSSAETINAALPRLKASKVKSGKKSVTVKWKKLSSKKRKKVSGIEIQCSTNKTFTRNVKTVRTGKKAVSKKIKGLSPKKKYYIRMRTFRKKNGEIDFSKWSGIKKVKTK